MAEAEQLSRQFVVEILRKTGYAEAAEEAERVLPDPVDREELGNWALKYGVTLDSLISRMGGSP
jgi:hypothetical protein